MTTRYQCPKCEQISDTFMVYGTLVTGECSVRFNANGSIQSVGPIRPKTIVKPGRELTGRVAITCPVCNYTGRFEDYIPIVSSILSGKRASERIVYPWLSEPFFVTTEEIPEAERIFGTDLRTAWDDTERVTALLGLR